MDPCLVIDLQDAIQIIFSVSYFSMVRIHYFSYIYTKKESQNGRIVGVVDPDRGGPKTCTSGVTGSG